MNWKQLFLASMCLSAIACERVVDIENPVPTPVQYCAVDEGLEGSWQSDSVWVSTSTDSTDTVYTNRRPAYFYTCEVACGLDTAFKMWSINFSGVKTLQHHAENYTAEEPFIRLYDPFDETRDSASMYMSLEWLSDSTIRLDFSNRLNDGQVTYTTTWMKKDLE